jgi:hypothetical protein
MAKLLTICVPGGNGYQECVTPRLAPVVEPETILRNGLTIMITIAVVLVVVYITWAGIRYILSRGDKQQVAGARNGITYALVGLVVVFLAFFLISLIGFIFGINIFTDS